MEKFQIQNGKHSVTIRFSDGASSPTLEDALVKILNAHRG